MQVRSEIHLQKRFSQLWEKKSRINNPEWHYLTMRGNNSHSLPKNPWWYRWVGNLRSGESEFLESELGQMVTQVFRYSGFSFLNQQSLISCHRFLDWDWLKSGHWSFLTREALGFLWIISERWFSLHLSWRCFYIISPRFSYLSSRLCHTWFCN